MKYTYYQKQVNKIILLDVNPSFNRTLLILQLSVGHIWVTQLILAISILQVIFL